MSARFKDVCICIFGWPAFRKSPYTEFIDLLWWRLIILLYSFNLSKLNLVYIIQNNSTQGRGSIIIEYYKVYNKYYIINYYNKYYKIILSRRHLYEFGV